jgi:hypothetical protein
MISGGFEPTIPVFQWAKALRDHARYFCAISMEFGMCGKFVVETQFHENPLRGSRILPSVQTDETILRGPDNKNYWVFGLCPSFGILKTRNRI